jgi:hypothetical protein
MFELDLIKRHAGRFHGFDGGVERARVPGDRDRHVAQIRECLNARILPDHDGARAHRGIEADDLAFPKLLHALDRAPFAHRVDFQRALLQLRFLPALREILYPALGALGIVLVVDHFEAFLRKEALFDRDAPGAVVGVAVALQTDGGGGHGRYLCAGRTERVAAVMPSNPGRDNGTCDRPVGCGGPPTAGAGHPLAIAPGAPRIHHCARANQKELPVAKLFVCRLCMVELERIALADGTAARVCVACGVIGLEHELAGGAPLSSTGLPRDAKAGRKPRPRRAPGREGAIHGR